MVYLTHFSDQTKEVIEKLRKKFREHYKDWKKREKEILDKLKIKIV